jgi:hypothetical protein
LQPVYSISFCSVIGRQGKKQGFGFIPEEFMQTKILLCLRVTVTVYHRIIYKVCFFFLRIRKIARDYNQSLQIDDQD